MQLVFVHGVATRMSVAYQQEQTNRNLLFEQVAFAGLPLKIQSPIWGDLVPKLRLDGAAFKTDEDVVAFAMAGGMGGGMGGSGEPQAFGMGDALAAALGDDPVAALDAIYAQLVQQADEEKRVLTDEEIALFKGAVDLIEGGVVDLHIPAGADNDAAYGILKAKLEEAQSFGLVDNLKSAAEAVADRARNLVSTAVSNKIRPALNPVVGRFLGDIFVYLKDGDVRLKIRALICGAIQKAHAGRKPGEKLILMGHSLGGVILYDILANPAAGELPPGFQADLFVTVGSQPGLFEEMGLFGAGPGPLAADQRTEGPAPAADWINIFDPIDVFGFRAETVFTKAKDYEFNSVTGLLDAHTTYFKRPQFHARLRQRLSERGLL